MMRRKLETILPLLVLVGFLATAVVVNLLVASARTRGVNALEESVEAEVSAIANSQNQRFVNTFASAGGLASPAGDPYELVEGSAADLVQLERLLLLLPNLRSGFYLLDAGGRITQGVQFLDPGIGESFEWPGYDELSELPTFAQGLGGVLPVAEGLTTEEPVLALVLPILDPASGSRRGAFVFESVVSADSDFNKEIGTLHRGQTGEYLFYDSAGSVIAASDPSLIGQAVGDDRLLTDPVGIRRQGDRIVALSDVPVVGWRVAFRQDVDEFEEPLAGPLDTAGIVLALALLSAGGALTLLLYARLRASRGEQARLAQLAAAQQELISIVSHELRTPVAGILGFLDTTIDHWETMDDAQRRSAVVRAGANATRLQAMTRDVLDTQAVELGHLQHVMLPLDLCVEVNVAVVAARELAPDRTFEVRTPTEPVWVDGDSDRLQRVLVELLDNAQSSSPVVEPIEVELTAGDDTVEVRVRDRGAGIAHEALDRIFDKFVRERGQTVSGTGLGLYIARQVIDAHGGTIRAESEIGAGATFSFTLPLRQAPDAPTEGAGSTT